MLHTHTHTHILTYAVLCLVGSGWQVWVHALAFVLAVTSATVGLYWFLALYCGVAASRCMLLLLLPSFKQAFPSANSHIQELKPKSTRTRTAADRKSSRNGQPITE
ncbi:unnamed protein product [Ceratitis capitata]|uniref:(Mediterranean fruit fly) hypothetical protein n=1 Tax=Ceratitis capitata TaxID=7213 RepID=A0A811U9X0_CERCA|nr:unnamed protein product [Ceratitis capitata]